MREEFGPAMKALRPQLRLWVLAMFEQGTMDQTAAARLAGFVDNQNGSIKVTAHRIAHRPEVRLAMQEEAKRRVTMMLPMADNAMIRALENPKHKDIARFVAMVYNRAGVPETVERNINVNVTLTDAEKIEKIRLLAEKHAIPLPQILGTVTDAEFSDVAEEPDAGAQDD